MMANKKVTILGAGNGGVSQAFHLTQMGFQVCLFEHPDFAKQALKPYQDAQNVIIAPEEDGGHTAMISGKETIAKLTDDISEAINWADIIMMIVPAFGQVPIFQMALPHIRDGQTFVIMPGNFASLQFAKLLSGPDGRLCKKVVFAETESIPYACRKCGDNKVFISGMKASLCVGVLPGEATQETLEKLRPLYTLQLIKLNNVLEAGFANINMIVHPPPTLLNIGWIESGQKFSFYRDGSSKSVCKVVDAIDEERVSVGKALGISVRTSVETFAGWYKGDWKNHYECFQGSKYHAYFPAPASIENRYILEDMAYVMIPIVRYLAPMVKVKTPVIDAMVTLAETALSTTLEPQREFSFILKKEEGLKEMHERLQKGHL